MGIHNTPDGNLGAGQTFLFYNNAIRVVSELFEGPLNNSVPHSVSKQMLLSYLRMKYQIELLNGSLTAIITIPKHYSAMTILIESDYD